MALKKLPRRCGRKSNLELLRIICMVLIILFHISMQTKIHNLGSKNGILYLLWIFMGSAGRLAINCFVMIGAYFLVDSEFKSSRIVNLWLQIFFYSVTITLLCLIFGVGNVSITNIVQAFLPIFGRPVWFGAEYICLLLLSPFLNKLIKQQTITKKLLQIFGFLIIVCATLFPIEHTTPAFSELVWFCFLYLLIGYWKRYMNEKCNLIGGIIALIVGYGFICVISIYSSYLGMYYINHYEALPSFASSLGLFMLFKNIKIEKSSRLINNIAHVVFPVYLIHQTPAFYNYLWNGIFEVDTYAYSYKGVLYCFIIVILLFIVSMVAEYIREKLFSTTVYRTKLYQNGCNILCDYLNGRDCH